RWSARAGPTAIAALPAARRRTSRRRPAVLVCASAYSSARSSASRKQIAPVPAKRTTYDLLFLLSTTRRKMIPLETLSHCDARLRASRATLASTSNRWIRRSSCLCETDFTVRHRMKHRERRPHHRANVRGLSHYIPAPASKLNPIGKRTQLQTKIKHPNPL